LCNFHVAAEVAAGRVKTAQGTAPAIPCKQVFYSLGLPTIDSKSRAKRNRNLSGCGLARLEEFSRSAIDSTLGARLVNHKKHSSDGGHRITSRARDARRRARVTHGVGPQNEKRGAGDPCGRCYRCVPMVADFVVWEQSKELPNKPLQPTAPTSGAPAER